MPCNRDLTPFDTGMAGSGAAIWPVTPHLALRCDVGQLICARSRLRPRHCVLGEELCPSSILSQSGSQACRCELKDVHVHSRHRRPFSLFLIPAHCLFFGVIPAPGLCEALFDPAMPRGEIGFPCAVLWRVAGRPEDHHIGSSGLGQGDAVRIHRQEVWRGSYLNGRCPQGSGCNMFANTLSKNMNRVSLRRAGGSLSLNAEARGTGQARRKFCWLIRRFYAGEGRN